MSENYKLFSKHYLYRNAIYIAEKRYNLPMKLNFNT